VPLAEYINIKERSPQLLNEKSGSTTNAMLL